MEINSARSIIEQREKILLNRLIEIKQRKLLQRDWKEEMVNKMEIIDIKRELANYVNAKKNF